MPRGPRLDFDGGIYHVMARGNRRQRIFADDEDRIEFLRRLVSVLGRTDVELHAFVLMPNHVHLVLRRRYVTVGRFMLALLSPYARYFNRRHGTVGHLFQNRYRALVCTDDTYLLRLVRYIHRNPLAARLAPTVRYPWSSYDLYLRPGLAPWLATGPVLKMLSDDPERARAAFAAFHESEEAAEEPPELFASGSHGVLGDESAVERAYRRAARTRRPLASERKPLDVLLLECVRQSALPVCPAEVRSSSRRAVAREVRARFVLQAVEQWGYSLTELAGFLSRSPDTVAALLSRSRRRAS